MKKIVLLASLLLLPFTAAASFDLNGTDNYLNVGNSSDYEAAGGSVSISFWMKCADYSGYHILFSRGSFGGNGFYVEFYNNQLDITHAGVNVLVTNISLPDSGWHHFIITHVDGAKWHVYLDKVEVAYTQQDNATLTPSTNSLSIGCHNLTNYFFKTKISCFRWWNKILSTQEMIDSYNNKETASANEVLFLKCLETSGTTAYDYTQHHNASLNGTLTNIFSEDNPPFPTHRIFINGWITDF